MKVRRLEGFVLSYVVSLATGCSTSYLPKSSPRVAIIQKGGTPAYVRDGKVYEGGMFGGDLKEAVSGNAEAEAHASAFKTGMVGGFITSVLGAVGMGAGLVVFASNTDTGGPASATGSDHSSGQTLGGAVFVGGLAAYLGGVAWMLSAQPHMWDAINVYNDGVLAGPLPPPAPPLGAYTPTAVPVPLPTVAPTSPPPAPAAAPSAAPQGAPP